jgi:hypothetical protein
LPVKVLWPAPTLLGIQGAPTTGPVQGHPVMRALIFAQH